MTRSVRTRGIAAAIFVALFGAVSVQAQVAPVASQGASAQRIVHAAVAPVQHGLAGAGIPARLATTPLAIADSIQHPTTPNVFGTVPLPLRLQPTGARWAKVMKAPLNQHALLGLTRPAGALSAKEQVAFVQSAVNRAVHRGASRTDCADDGYWAAAEETLSRGAGDCIDIAIAKMEALRLLGIPQNDLYLTTGYVGGNRNTGGARESAALLVRVGGDFWLMPERSGQVIDAGRATGLSPAFDPMVTYGVGMNWVHGRRKLAATGY